MIELFNTILYQPLFNLLIWFYNIIPGQNLGWAIIALTVVVKIVLYPFFVQQIRSQKAMQAIQPKIKELQEKFKDQKDKLAKEMMELYKREKVNPFASCLPLLIQLPFLIAVYQVFRAGLNAESLDMLYSFVANPGHINHVFLGVIDLAKVSLPLAILAGAAQFWQAKMLQVKKPPPEVAKSKGAKDESMMSMMNKQMLYFMPAITVLIGASLPAGLMLYWFLMTLLSVGQQYIMFRGKPETQQQ